MRAPASAIAGRKRTVSLTLTAELVERAKAQKLNLSALAEEALAKAVAEREREELRAEIAAGIAFCDAYEAEHGSFAEMVQEYNESLDPPT